MTQHKRQAVSMISTSLNLGLSGMLRAGDRLDLAAAQTARAGTPLAEGDLSDALVSIIEAQTSFTASAKTVEAANDMARHTIDILA